MQTSSQTPARTKAQSADDIADAALASLRRLSPSAQARHLRKMTPAELQALDLAMQRAERAQQSAGGRALSRYRDDPAGFASDVLGVRLWSRQIEICRAVAEHPRVAVRSGHKVGKSTSAVVLALWWVCTRERGYVAMTSATARQVRAVLWRELRHVYRKHRSVDGALIDPSERIGGTLHKVPDRGLEFDDDRAIIGFTADSAENAAGISGAEVLFIVDEASGVEGQIFDALEGNRAGGARMVMFGNPTKTTGEFHAAFHAKRPFYRTVHVSSEEAAEVTPPIPGLATRAWVDEKRAEWGTDSPLYAVRVAGNFPRQSANAVIGVDVVEAAIARWRDAFGQGDDSDTALERATLEGSEPLRIGVDVARYGDDESIIATRRGRAVYDLRAFQGLDGPQLAGHVIVAARERRRGEEPVVVAVDETGVGASCLDALRAASPPWLTVVGVNSASAPREGETYLNLRAQLAFDLRDFLRGGGAIPDDSHAAQELVATTYSFGARNRIQIVSKDDLKKQIGRSPDRFDALALAVFEPRVWDVDDSPPLSVASRRR